MATVRKDTRCLTLAPGDAPRARPAGVRRRPTRARELVPGTTAFPPGDEEAEEGEDGAETRVRERWALQRAAAIDEVREAVDAFRADLLAPLEADAARVFRKSPTRRARWLARRVASAHRCADRFLAERLASIDEPAEESRTTQGQGAFWLPICVNQASGEVVDGEGVVRVTLTVTGDDQWQAVAMRTLWGLAAHARATARPLRLVEGRGAADSPEASA